MSSNEATYLEILELQRSLVLPGNGFISRQARPLEGGRVAWTWVAYNTAHSRVLTPVNSTGLPLPPEHALTDEYICPTLLEAFRRLGVLEEA